MVDSDSLRLLHMDGRFCKSLCLPLFSFLSPSLGSVGNSGLRAVDESIASPGAQSGCHHYCKNPV